MSSLGSPNPFFIAGKKAYEVERSLRFNPSDITNLERTFASAGNRRTWTWSGWVKRSGLGNSRDLFSPYRGGDGSNESRIYFSNEKLRLYDSGGSSGYPIVRTAAVFRDVSAWYHFVVAVDTTQSTASDRIKIYANGVLQELDETTYGNQNQQLGWNNNNIHRVGAYGYPAQGSLSSSHIYDGYLAEVNFIDGFQYDPSYFGETDVITGQWNPKKYTGSYGTNGFYLNFSDNSGTTATTLGKDSSGNGNNFTPNNFSVSAGAGNDSLEDTPTNNFCTLNPLKTFGTYALSNGNLTVSGSARFDSVGTFAVSSGKWFWEITNTDVGIAYNGILNINQFRTAPGAIGSGGVYTHYVYDGTKYRDANPSGASAYGASYTDGDIVGVALNLDDNEITFYKNGTSQGAITIPNDLYTAYLYSDSGSYNYSINFGQRAFSYTAPTGYKALNSANLPEPTIKLPNKHFDTLLYTGTDTSASRTLTGLNFSPDWIWQKRRNGTNWNTLMDQVRGVGKTLFSNDTSAEATNNQYGYLSAFTSDGFTWSAGSTNNSDGNETGGTFVSWCWNGGDTDGKTYTVKVVSDSGNKYRFDDFGTSAVTLDLAEGGTYTFDQSDSSMSSHPMQLSTTANGTHGGGSAYSTGVTYQLDGSTVTASAFISGFSSATSRKLIITVAASAPTLYYYCYYHSGMGGAVNTNSTLGSSNFGGSIQSTVKVNASAGFSIGLFTGTGSNASIGHGLGVAPSVVIAKSRSHSDNWFIYHKSLGANAYIMLNSTNAADTGNSTVWQNVSPTSSVFYASTGGYNDSGQNLVFYAFSEVAGYSKFGSYVSNGASSDNTFVFTGFRPAWVMIKASSTGGSISYSWMILDNTREPFNSMFKRLQPNESASETTNTGTTAYIDFLSNGFKIRGNGSLIGQSGVTYIYLCFAESPFKYARAR